MAAQGTTTFDREDFWQTLQQVLDQSLHGVDRTLRSKDLLQPGVAARALYLAIQELLEASADSVSEDYKVAARVVQSVLKRGLESVVAGQDSEASIDAGQKGQSIDARLKHIRHCHRWAAHPELQHELKPNQQATLKQYQQHELSFDARQLPNACDALLVEIPELLMTAGIFAEIK
jgi:hypothetical protein